MVIRFFILSLVFLTTLKVAAVYFTNFNMFGDEAQYWLWSESLDFGYFSKPPLIAWLISFYSWFFGNSFMSLKLMPVFLYFLTSLAVYELCLRLGLKRKDSVLCFLSFLTMPAVSVSSFFISTDVVLLLFWTLSMIALLNIKKTPSFINFMICGIMVGLAFLSKYAAIYFFVSLSALCFFDKVFRCLFFQNIFKSFLLVFTVFIIILPNIIWNYNNDWITLQHTSANADLKNFNLSFTRGMVFLITQILMVGVFLFLGTAKNIKTLKLDAQNIFLLCFSLPIILIVFLESVIVRANANWAAVGLIALFIFFIRPLLINFKLYVILNYIFNLVLAVIFYTLIATSFSHKVFDRINGVESFAKEIKILIGENTNVVISDRLLYSSLSYELRGMGIDFLMPYNPSKTITKHFQLSSPLKKNIKESFVFMGELKELGYLESSYNFRLIKEISVKFTNIPIKVYEVSF